MASLAYGMSVWLAGELARLAREDAGQIDFGLGDIITSLGNIFDAFVSDFLAALANAMVYAYYLLNYIWQVLLAVGNFLYNGLLKLLAWMESTGLWIWHNVLSKIVSWVQRLRAELHKIFAPVLDVLRKIKALQDWYYQNILKPVMQFIQRLRGVLLIFRLLHFRFAQQLDGYLAKQEGKLAQAFLVVTQQLNQLINWVNWLSDPFGLISSNVYLWTAARSINDLWAMLQGIQSGSLTGAQTSGQAHDASIGTRTEVIADVRAGAGGHLNADDTALLIQAAQDFASLGYT